MATNGFLNYANDENSEIMPQEDYVQQAALGAKIGIADLKLANKAWHQAALIGAVVGALIATDQAGYTGVNVDDSETVEEIKQKVINVLKAMNTQSIKDNTTIVKTSGNQTVNGLKTFNTLPQSSKVPSNDKDFSNKKYVDDTVDGHADEHGSSSAFGHVKLSDSTTGAETAANGIAATPKAVAIVAQVAEQAASDASEAVETAESAETTANTANGTANTAKTTAETAQTTANGALQRSGGTMTGALILKGNPSQNLEAVPKQYVDNQVLTAVPTGTVLAYGGRAVPTGFLNGNGAAVSRTTYQPLFKVYSTYWGSGDGSTTFNIIDGRNRTIWGANAASNVGSYLSAGLPNITGYFATVHGPNYIATSGACYMSNRPSNSTNNGLDAYSANTGTVSFSANRSSGIYGASNTVQTASAQMLLIIKT